MDINQKIDKLWKKRGEEGANIFLANLENGRQFIEALNAPAGQQIMSMIADKFSQKMAEIISMKGKSCSDCALLLTKIELEQSYTLLKEIAKKINKYEERSKEFKDL